MRRVDEAVSESRTPVPGWPPTSEPIDPAKPTNTGRMVIWMTLIALAVVVLGYLLVKQMLGL
jgi:predicted secreted protein